MGFDMDLELLGKELVDSAYKVHTELGPGLLESVYEVSLSYELARRGFKVQRQVPMKIKYEDIYFDEGFRADIIINDLVIIELKSVEKLHPVHKKQLLTYLKLTGRNLGFLINFGEVLIKNGIIRIVNNYQE
ncbi:GxxExxY protein [Lentisphaera marina]|uniref:GxxExxY protein n=1 Tax=Lentisphaera marina TaxID=1111041 RepID=UPI0023657483|nr:GxxExxY protein [Lentisphaera marina]MDD7983977.1 GxxExxY protein [Lentisphaera marina]